MARAQSSGSGTWMDHLPFVLLGLRTAIRDDSDCSPADLLYGSSLCLPADLLESSTSVKSSSPSAFVEDLRDVMRSSQPMPFLYHGQHASNVPASLSTCSHVFVRVDAVRRPLSPPYDGPFAVVARHEGDKTFIIAKNGKQVTVSMDRLKPAATLPDPDPGPRPQQAVPVPPPASPVAAAAPSTAVDPVSSLDPAVSGLRPDLDPVAWPLPTRFGRRPRPVDRLGIDP